MVTEGANTKAQVLDPVNMYSVESDSYTHTAISLKLITEAHICQFMQGH